MKVGMLHAEDHLVPCGEAAMAAMAAASAEANTPVVAVMVRTVAKETAVRMTAAAAEMGIVTQSTRSLYCKNNLRRHSYSRTSVTHAPHTRPALDQTSSRRILGPSDFLQCSHHRSSKHSAGTRH